MLYYFLYPLTKYHAVFNVFQYITFRTIYAVVTALVLSFVLGPFLIRKLKRMRVGEVVSGDGPPSHINKTGTPTMGGTIILFVVVISVLLWGNLANVYIWILTFLIVGMGIIGFVDDYGKVVSKRGGLKPLVKFIAQVAVALVAALALYYTDFDTTVTIPFFKDVYIELGAFYVPFMVLVIVGTSNAVNLTDGLDGLAAGLVAIAAATFGIFAYLLGRVDASAYLGLFYLPGAEELSILALALTGGCLGFLWFNAHPAEVFMGDTGSLAIGGVIGAMAILLKAEFLLVIVGGVFVMETLSVVLQVGYFRYSARKYGTGRRLFRMAPIHHHFEQLGWPETKVVIRFWIMGILCAMVAFSALKIR